MTSHHSHTRSSPQKLNIHFQAASSSSSSSSSNTPYVLGSSKAHNEQSNEPCSPTKARSRSRSPFKRQKKKQDSVQAREDEPFQQLLPSGDDAMNYRESADAATSSSSLQQRFDEMLASREIPIQIRANLANLNPAIKESLVRNQETVDLASLGAFGFSSATHHNAASLAKGIGMPSLDRPSFRPFPSQDPGSSSASASSKDAARNSAQESIFNSGRGRSRSPTKSLISPRNPSPRRPTSSSVSLPSSSTQYARMLLDAPSTRLDIEKLRRLRVLLSTESPSWLAEFLFTERGYEGLMRRTGELIEMEWRDEVHDDKALHELLRGLVALGPTDRGRLALTSLLFRPYQAQLSSQPVRSSHLPTTTVVGAPEKEVNPPELPVGWERHPPFGPLTAMLLSDRKPGDLDTRRLIVELLGILPTLALPQGLKQDVFDLLKSDREVSSCYEVFVSKQEIPTTAQLLLLLLHNPISSRSLSLLPFISQSHHPRPFKTYLHEISAVVRDYFWIFCHGQNRFLDWRGMGEEERKKVDGPSVPGGMTGGVEFEAIGYITAHFRLINRVAEILSSSSPPTKAPLLFHQALFDSGMERLLLTLRRASQQYYGPMHLTLAHYVHLATMAGHRLSNDVKTWCHRSLQLRNADDIGDGKLGVSFEDAMKQGRAIPDAHRYDGGRVDCQQSPPPPLKPEPLFSSHPSNPAKKNESSRPASPIKSPQRQMERSSAPPRDTSAQQSQLHLPRLVSPLPTTTSTTLSSSKCNPGGLASSESNSSGHWLTGNATALFVASSISSESFFSEAWPTEEDAVACSVPLPLSPAKSGRRRDGEDGSGSGSGGGKVDDVRMELPATDESEVSRHELPRTRLLSSPEGPSSSLVSSTASTPPPSTSTSTAPRRSTTAVKSTAAAHRDVPGLVVVGTARDRIRLWEGRVNGTSSSSNADR